MSETGDLSIVAWTLPENVTVDASNYSQVYARFVITQEGSINDFVQASLFFFVGHKFPAYRPRVLIMSGWISHPESRDG